MIDTATLKKVIDQLPVSEAERQVLRRGLDLQGQAKEKFVEQIARLQSLLLASKLSATVAEELTILLRQEPSLKDAISDFFGAAGSGTSASSWQNEKISELAKEALGRDETKLQILRWGVTQASGDPGDARTAYQILTDLLSKTGLDKKADPFYERQRHRLGWFGFATIPDSAAEELLRRAVLFGLRDELPVRERLELRLVGTVAGFTGGAARQNLLTAFSQNEERLGERPIRISGEATDSSPTLANWLRDYARSTREGRERGAPEEVYYLEHSENAKKLSEQDKKWLLEILSLYDFLLFRQVESSLTISLRHQQKAEQEKIRRPFVTPHKQLTTNNRQQNSSPLRGEVKEGVIHPPQTPPLKGGETAGDPSRSLSRQVAGLGMTMQKCKRDEVEVKKIILQMGVDPTCLAGRQVAEFTPHKVAGLQDDKRQEVVKILQEAVKSQNKLRALAALQALGSQIIKLVAEDKQFSSELALYLEKKLGHAAVISYHNNPARPTWVGWYWRYVLVDQLKMPEDEAKLWVLALGNHLEGEYKKLVYLDAKTKQLRWNEQV